MIIKFVNKIPTFPSYSTVEQFKYSSKSLISAHDIYVYQTTKKPVSIKGIQKREFETSGNVFYVESNLESIESILTNLDKSAYEIRQWSKTRHRPIEHHFTLVEYVDTNYKIQAKIPTLQHILKATNDLLDKVDYNRILPNAAVKPLVLTMGI